MSDLTKELVSLIEQKVKDILSAAIKLALPDMEERICTLELENTALRDAVEYWRQSSEFWAGEAERRAYLEDEDVRLRKKTGINPDSPIMASEVITGLKEAPELPKPPIKMIGPSIDRPKKPRFPDPLDPRNEPGDGI